ncbi:MAG TPA: BatA domain-containing protein [bacterium]|nr:BatA domain-containing protein [bacterium]HOL47465.1 BatA domain-containing protein [bacterium]HPQ18945.1 BatA domain-containing protein [bacterium]
MNFLYPYFFYFLAFIIVPIIISIIKFSKKKKIYFSSLLILKQIYFKQRKILRIKNLLILLLRILIIVLIVLFFADFQLDIERSLMTNILSAKEPVILLDNSLSMLCKAVEGTLFDKAKLFIKETIKEKDILKKIEINQVFKSIPFISSSNKNELYNIIDKLKIEKEVMNLSIELNKLDNHLINKDIFYITDNFEVFNDYENINIKKYRSFNIIQVASNNNENISIIKTDVINFFSTLNIPYQVDIEIQNFSNKEKNNFGVYLSIFNNERFDLIDNKFIDLLPNNKTKVSFIIDNILQSNVFRISINKDEFEIDNDFYFVINKIENLKIKIYNNEVKNIIQTIYNNTDIKFINLIDKNDDNYNAIIIGASMLSENIVNDIKKAIEENKNILIYTDADFDIRKYNTFYTNKKMNINNFLPGIIKEKVINNEFEKIDKNHLICKIYDEKELKVNFLINESYKIMKDIISVSIISFNDGADLLVEKKINKSKIILAGFNLESKELLKNYKFIPLIIQTIDYLSYNEDEIKKMKEGKIIYKDEYNNIYFDKEAKKYYTENISRNESELKIKEKLPNEINKVTIKEFKSRKKLRLNFLIQNKNQILLVIILLIILLERYFSYIRNY